MRHILTVVALALLAGGAYAYDFSALQQQLMANPAVQQQVGKQVMQQAAANPQLATQFLGSLTPQQNATLQTQLTAVAARLFTPAEQSKLTAFQSTPEGAGIIAKLPTLMQQMAPVVLQMYMGQTGQVVPAAGAKGK